MPLPEGMVCIDPSHSIQMPDYAPGSKVGPFGYGSWIFGVFFDKTNANIEVWGSSDAGATWAELDGENHPTTGSTDGEATGAASVVMSGTTLHIGYLVDPVAPEPYSPYDIWGTKRVVIQTFDMVTRTWSGDVIGGGPWAVGLATYPIFYMARKSTGDYVILHQTVFEVLGSPTTRCARVAYSVWDAATETWTLDQAIPGQTGSLDSYEARAVLLGADDRIHFFWVTGRMGVVAHPLHHLTLGQTTPQTIYDSIWFFYSDTEQECFGTPTTWTSGGSVYLLVPIVGRYSTGIPSPAYRMSQNVLVAVSADEPTWTDEEIDRTTYPGGVMYGEDGWGTQSSIAVTSGGDIWLYWCAQEGQPASLAYSGQTWILARSQRLGADSWSASELVSHPPYDGDDFNVARVHQIPGGYGLFFVNRWLPEDYSGFSWVPYYVHYATATVSGCRYYGF